MSDDPESKTEEASPRKLEEAREKGDVAVSAATVWEIAIKRMLGRIAVDLKELIAAIGADQFVELPGRFAHSLVLQSLPRHHDDPFDRILIAQAIAEGRRLVTRDGDVIELYAGIGG